MTELKTTSESVLAISRRYSASTEALKELFPEAFKGQFDTDEFDMDDVNSQTVSVLYGGVPILTITRDGIRRCEFGPDDIPIRCDTPYGPGGYSRLIHKIRIIRMDE